MTGNHIISWRIKKMNGSLRLPLSVLDLSLDNPSTDLTVTRLGDGKITAWALDSDVATVSLSNTNLKITRKNEGTTNVVVMVDSSDFYNAPPLSYIEVHTGASTREIARPSADVVEFSFGGTKTVTINNGTSNYFETVKGSELSASALGEHTITYRLTDENSVWKGNTPKKRIPKPEVPITDLIFVEGESYPLPVNNAEDFIKKYFSVTGDTVVSSTGKYSVTFALNDTDTTVWMDNSTKNFSVSWTATAQKKT